MLLLKVGDSMMWQKVFLESSTFLHTDFPMNKAKNVQFFSSKVSQQIALKMR